MNCLVSYRQDPSYNIGNLKKMLIKILILNDQNDNIPTKAVVSARNQNES